MILVFIIEMVSNSTLLLKSHISLITTKVAKKCMIQIVYNEQLLSIFIKSLPISQMWLEQNTNKISCSRYTAWIIILSKLVNFIELGVSITTFIDILFGQIRQNFDFIKGYIVVILHKPTKFILKNAVIEISINAVIEIEELPTKSTI